MVGVEVAGITSHRNNLMYLNTTKKEWNKTYVGLSQVGSFTVVNGFLAFTVQDKSKHQDGILYLLKIESGELLTSETAYGWGDVFGSFTPRPPHGNKIYVITNQDQVQTMDATLGRESNWLPKAINLAFEFDVVLYNTDIIYIDHGGPCRGRQQDGPDGCIWLYSFGTSHFPQWLRTDILDGRASITKNLDDMIFLMSGSDVSQNNRIYMLNPSDGTTIHMIEFQEPFFHDSKPLSVSNVKKKGLDNIYFVQKITKSKPKDELQNGWYLFAFPIPAKPTPPLPNQRKNRLRESRLWAIPIDSIADPNDGCYAVSISEDGNTVCTSCQNYQQGPSNAVMCVDVSTGHINFKKVLDGYGDCSFVSIALNGKVVVTCGIDIFSNKKNSKNRISRKNGAKRAVLVFGKDGKMDTVFDFSKLNEFVGLRPMLDSENNLYMLYANYGTPSQCTVVRRSLN